MTTALIQADVVQWLRERQWLAQNGYWPKYMAVFADPPYGLEFMGQEWDKPKPSEAHAMARTIRANEVTPTGKAHSTSAGPFLAAGVNGYVAGPAFQAWVTEWARLLLDFVYPGAVLVMFGGTRTYHRLAAGLEDAGWEIADSLMYLYGSGFPKSHDISKAIDKAAGAEREVVGSNPNHRPISGVQYEGIYSGGNTGNPNITAPATPDAARWSGYGTALKPAYEPIVLARAPRAPHTYAQLAQQFGTGALNVDGARIGTEVETWPKSRSYAPEQNQPGGKGKTVLTGPMPPGRWPANLILSHTERCNGTCAPDCPVRLLGEQSGESVSRQGHRDPNGSMGYHGGASGTPFRLDGYTDAGNASRFFYTAKAAAWERSAGQDVRSTHPTLKPITLTEYLARLILPPPLTEPRRLLIPFAGVASEMLGARLAGWDEITGIEQSAEYVAQGQARLAWWAQYATYEQAQAAYQSQQAGAQADAEREQAGQLTLFDYLEQAVNA